MDTFEIIFELLFKGYYQVLRDGLKQEIPRIKSVPSVGTCFRTLKDGMRDSPSQQAACPSWPRAGAQYQAASRSARAAGVWADTEALVPSWGAVDQHP